MVEALAMTALCVSCASLGVSVWLLVRDRDRLRAASKFYPAEGGHPAWMEIQVVNKGRRPIVLVSLMREFADGTKAGTTLGAGKGIRLDEGQKFTEELYVTDPDFLCSAEGCAAVDLWLKDSRGHRFGITEARVHLQRLIRNEASQK